jgi:glycerophosphoryl diester phosphodiesterase
MRAPIWIKPGSSKLLVGGHRGASAVAPENTAAAFEAAIAAGADFIETDLRLTRDGVPVAFHDGDLRRLTGDPRQVSELDLDELRGLHPGIVAMADAIDLVGERASILLDTKLYDLAALERCIAVLGARLQTGRIAFGVRSRDVFGVIHARLPQCPTLGLFADIGDYPELAARGGNWARLWEKDASADNIEKLQQLGLKVIIMAGQPMDGSVGLIERDVLRALCALGPDAVMLNDPSLAIDVVAQLPG